MLSDLVTRETEKRDLVASWEELCAVYEMLGFTDKLTDDQKIDEFKWIVRELNKFLTRERKELFSARDEEAAYELLADDICPKGDAQLTSRKQIAYHKLRQRWIVNTMVVFDQIIKAQAEEELGETYDSDEYY